MWQKFYVDYHPDAPSFFIGLETRNKLVELINAHLIRRLRVQKEVRAKTICKMYLCTPLFWICWASLQLKKWRPSQKRLWVLMHAWIMSRGMASGSRHNSWGQKHDPCSTQCSCAKVVQPTNAPSSWSSFQGILIGKVSVQVQKLGLESHQAL